MATKNKGAGRVAWSSEQFNLFVKICVRGTNLGKRNGGWGDKGYTWLQNELRQVGVEYTKEQLRHKWDWMKDQWKMWKALKGNETGLGWDPIKGTVVAPDEWWNEKIKENSNFARFREKGIGQELYENYQELFLGTVATGEFAYAPSSGVLPNETQETQQFDTADHVEENINAESNFDDDLNDDECWFWIWRFIQSSNMNVVQRMIWDDDDDEVWQTTTYAVDIICSYYLSYIHKEPCMDSFHTGLVWLQEIMRALGASNRQVQERFQHSGETVSRNFHEVLKAMLCLSIDMIKPTDPTFSNIPPEILNDDRYMPHFKDCIGAIDGTHVSACVQEENLIRFIGRKGVPTQNIMAACSFDMQFTFVMAGWEGTAHDGRLFQKILCSGCWISTDGYLAPYKGTRYHLPDFQRGGRPRGLKENFNRWHSSLRCCIERTFGVWKARWKILRTMPPYSFYVQRDIVVVCMALHNYIRRKALADPAFERLDKSPNFVPPDIFRDVDDIQAEESSQESGALQMNALRDQIACSLMLANNDY
ncbi:hypothetical protein GH714_041657 [Hevea brasiliensis]|uniref:Myb/SANT-like domain-containing protein n=1 Tax=Hevea brasiliensis TaxID=3981 RepID=A0A6A6MVI9_HEVBR|nr:hypothetical protein GH714_041657 [Hevea brasiliensis]